MKILNHINVSGRIPRIFARQSTNNIKKKQENNLKATVCVQNIQNEFNKAYPKKRLFIGTRRFLRSPENNKDYSNFQNTFGNIVFYPKGQNVHYSNNNRSNLKLDEDFFLGQSVTKQEQLINKCNEDLVGLGFNINNGKLIFIKNYNLPYDYNALAEILSKHNLRTSDTGSIFISQHEKMTSYVDNLLNKINNNGDCLLLTFGKSKHTAILFKHDNKIKYFSFDPQGEKSGNYLYEDDEIKNKLIIQMYCFNDTLSSSTSINKQEPDLKNCVKLENMDTEKMLSYFEKPGKYNFLTNNCASVTNKAILAGFKFRIKHKVFLPTPTNTHDLAQTLHTLQKKMKIDLTDSDLQHQNQSVV